MFIRYWYNFVRFSGLFLIPLIIIPIVSTLYLFSLNKYDAGASFWVQDSPYITINQTSNGFSYDSPSQGVGGLLTELMTTRDFMNKVIDSTPGLESKASTDSERLNLITSIKKALKIDTSGYRLVQLDYTDSNPQIALQALIVIVNNFKAYYDDNITKQTKDAVDYYNSLLQKDQATLAANDKIVIDFLNTHTDIGNTIVSNQPNTPDEIQYQELVATEAKSRQQVQDDETALNKVQQDYAAFLKGGGTNISIQDPPKVFNANTSKSRDILVGLAIGIIATLVLAVLFTIIVTLLDKTIRQSSYAQYTLKLGQVINLPAIEPQRSWYRDLEAQHESRLASNKLLSAPNSATTTPQGKGKKKAKLRFPLKQLLSWQIRTY